MYLHKTPFLLKKLYPSLTWNKSRSEKVIYLTFDDGPIPEVTEFVLNTLENFKAKATFFCVGDNVDKHPSVFKEILSKDHAVGNHTFNHLNGFNTDNRLYFDNIKKCSLIIKNPCTAESRLFRPPYGRIRKAQIDVVKRDYEIIMWDVLSGDFDRKLAPEKCLRATIKHTKPGSIVVFHDSLKTYSTLRYVLPKYLQHFTQLGFSFEALD